MFLFEEHVFFSSPKVVSMAVVTVFTFLPIYSLVESSTAFSQDIFEQ